MIKKQVVDKPRVLFDLYKDFEQYPDKKLIENVVNENINSVIDSFYEDQDIDLRIDIYVLNKLKHIILCNLVEKVRNEEDLNTEIYLISYFNYVHYLYVRKHGIELDNKLYELAIERTINEYDGVSSLSTFVYKKIAEAYEQNNKNIKVLLK